MHLIERYVFRRMLGAFAVVFPALSLTIWLSQSLRSISLVTDRGQGLVTFFRITVLIFPALVMIIAPLAVLAAAIYTLNTLNTDSELVSINAGGRSQRILVRPTMALSLLVAAAVATSTLYLTPNSIRASRELVTEVNASVVGSVIREGQFRQLGPGLTVNVRQRDTSGILHGLFVFDTRDSAQTIAYIAARGALVDNPLGKFLLLQDGVIQRQIRKTGAVTIIEFQSYAFDLASLAGRTSASGHSPQEQSTAYLLDPDPSDPYLQSTPGALTAELHDRFSSPLYVFVFGLVPVVFLGQVRSTRGRNVGIIIAAAAATVAVRGLGFVVLGAVRQQPALAPLLYAVPLGAIALSLVAIFAGMRVEAPSWFKALVAANPLARRLAAGQASPASS